MQLYSYTDIKCRTWQFISYDGHFLSAEWVILLLTFCWYQNDFKCGAFICNWVLLFSSACTLPLPPLKPLSSSDGEIEERGDNYMRKRGGKKGRRKRHNLLFEVNITRIVHRHCTWSHYIPMGGKGKGGSRTKDNSGAKEWNCGNKSRAGRSRKCLLLEEVKQK